LQIKGPVNKSIHSTLRDEPGRFLPYNNGLCCTAAEVRLTELPNGMTGLSWAKDFQIVNGGQTTASIFFSKKDGLDVSKINLMAKINIAKNISNEDLNELISNISLYSNTQSKVSKVETKSKYVIHHVIDTSNRKLDVNAEYFPIGVNPMLANPIVKALLLSNQIAMFQDITELKAEVTIEESRFDFSFQNKDGKKVYLEVKNVPLADVVDVTAKERKKLNLEHNMSKYDINKKIAIFPDGYRKNKDEPVSPRALKHVNHLSKIHQENPDIICALVFLIQRNDVEYFKPSSLDPIYHKAVYDAVDAGVHVLPICVTWIGSECKFLKNIVLLDRNFKSI
jgi:DNA-binding sugar fermentation-stimulating protein